MNTDSNADRLTLLCQQLDQQDQYLLAVRDRFLGASNTQDRFKVDTDRLLLLVTDTAGIDRLESFAAKFS